MFLLCLSPLLVHSTGYVNRTTTTKQSLETNVNSHIRHKINKTKQGAEIGYNEQVYDNLSLGGEMDFEDFSQMDFDSLLNFTQLGVDLLATATLSLSDDFALFAKAGMTNVEDGTQHPSTSDSKTVKSNPKVVLGSDYNVNKHLSITGKVSHTFEDAPNAPNPLLDKKGSEATGGSIGFKLKW